MRWPRPLALKETLDLPEVDPARMWVIVADPARMTEWTSAVEMLAPPELITHEATFAAVHRFGPVRYRVDYLVTGWEAGRRYRLEVAGLPLAEDAEFGCRVEAMVEGDHAWTRLELMRRLTVPAPAWALALALGRRGLRKSALRLGELAS